MTTLTFRKPVKKSRKLNDLYKVVEDGEVSSKIAIYLSKKTAGDDYDEYEKNYTETNLNPITIKGYVREISSEALVWKQYGLANVGAKEILCRKAYRNYFENCNKIVIDDIEYQVFREGVGQRAIIQERPFGFLRIVVQRKV